MTNNHYHCDISVCSDGSLDLSAFDKDYLMFFTGFKVRRANARRGVRVDGQQRKRFKVDDLLSDFNLPTDTQQPL